MKIIPLSQGRVAVVDDCDYDWLIKCNWCVNILKSKYKKRYYATTKYQIGSGKTRIRKTVMMHRAIIQKMMGEKVIPEQSFITDHINGDGLDNRRSNLRICTNAQNQYNRFKTCLDVSISVYKGLAYKKGGWEAALMIGGRTKYLGRFSSERLAAFAYDEAARCFHGNFIRLNLPDLTNEEYEDLKNQLVKAKRQMYSQYRGVSWRKDIKKWSASIKYNRQNYHLGFFKDEAEAAKVYDKKAVELLGHKAKLNF